MALRHCGMCGLNFPPYSGDKCSVCGESTIYDSDSMLAPTWIADMETKKRELAESAETDTVEQDKILNWRMLQLSKGGYTDASVITALAEADVNFRQAIDLLQRGCPEQLCAEILL